MSTIYLFRHGQASFGAKNYDKLSDLGCEQAIALDRYLFNSGIQFDAAYTGDLADSKQFQKAIEAVFNFWVSDKCPDVGIQTWRDSSTQVTALFDAVQQEQGAGKTMAIFTSSITITTIVAYVLGLSGSQNYQFYKPVISCSITQIFYNNHKSSLSCSNDYSYLKYLGMVTYR